jgi:hypothetical protein
MGKYIKKINEQMTSAPSREKERTTVPTRPGIRPGTKPRRPPSPIRRNKPSVKPKPKATAEGVYNRFIDELRNSDGNIQFDIQKLKSKYGVSENEVVKGFAQFLYEASLEDNPGLPDGYRSDVARRASIDTSATMRELGRKIPQFMSIVQDAVRLQSGNERQLEELAESAIRELYGSILDGVKLDIKFPSDAGEIPSEMEDSEMEPPQDQEELTDPEVIGEIQKRKIANNITQGEAKNTKLILNMDLIKGGLIEIMGQEDGEKYVTLLNEITKIASFFDWDIPMEAQKQMWQNPSGFSGSVSVDWEEPESEEEVETIERSAEDIMSDLEDGADIEDTEAEELFDDLQPTIKARGKDFAMLIHETVKGIYELIAAAGIPEDEEVAQTVIMNTDTLADEIEDLRFGPYIAADLRDFVNEFSEATQIENLRERFFGKLMEMPAADFLDLIKNILMGSNSAKTQSQEIIDDISQELSDYKSGEVDDMFGDDPEDYSDDLEDFNLPATMDEPSEVEGNYEDTLSQSEIKALIDTALDNGDFAEVERLAKYLKESIDSFKNLVSFNNFKQLNENVKIAKSYYLKKVKGDFLKKKEDIEVVDGELPSDVESDQPIELSPEQQSELLNDEDFLFIMNLVKNSPNYAVPFVKFKYDQGATLDDLSNVFNLITNQSNKSLLGNLPLGSVNAYAALENTEGENPGYELLGDHMTTLITKKEGMWIVKSLSRSAGTRDATGRNIPGKTPIDQKRLYENATQEIKDKIIDIASQFKSKEFDVKGFKRMISKYTTLEAIIEAMEIKINTSGTPMAENIKLHQAEFPGSSIVWEGADKFLVIYRSSWTLGKFCGFTDWCNRPSTGPYQVSSGGGMSGRFHSYASDGKVQFAMWDYSKSQTDPMRLVGFTIDPYGNLTAAADVPNNYSSTPGKIGGSSKKLKDVLEYFEVPEVSKQYVLDSLEGESDLMKEVGPIYKVLEENSATGEREFLKLIEKSRINSIKAEYGKSDGKIISGLASRVIASHIANNADSDRIEKTRRNIWDTVTTKGLKSEGFVTLFKLIFNGSSYMTESNIDRLISINVDIISRSNKVLKLATSPRKKDRRMIEETAIKHGKTLDELIHNAKSTIKAIEKINRVHLEAMKSVVGNN